MTKKATPKRFCYARFAIRLNTFTPTVTTKPTAINGTATGSMDMMELPIDVVISLMAEVNTVPAWSARLPASVVSPAA